MICFLYGIAQFIALDKKRAMVGFAPKGKGVNVKAFEFACPTKIIAGAHTLDKLPDELADRGVEHPLVMTDAAGL